jgi:hypothetical protein
VRDVAAMPVALVRRGGRRTPSRGVGRAHPRPAARPNIPVVMAFSDEGPVHAEPNGTACSAAPSLAEPGMGRCRPATAPSDRRAGGCTVARQGAARSCTASPIPRRGARPRKPRTSRRQGAWPDAQGSGLPRPSPGTAGPCCSTASRPPISASGFAG